jgi:PKD repeat protein
MKHFKKYSWAVLLLLIVPLIFSCKKDEAEPDVIASFTYAQDASNFLLYTFTNTSQNYSTVSWNFGDGSAAATEVNPTHTFPAEGTYTVTLTATSTGGKTDTYASVITLADPNEMLTRLTGATSKTWKLLRDVSGGVYPLEVGPWDRSTIWWAMGKGNDELANRPCMLNDEFTFGRDGSLVIDRKGDYWAEGGIYSPDNVCTGTDAMVGTHGEDLTVWGGGNFTFTLDPANNKITSNGAGAFIGFEKLGNGQEVMFGTSATNPITPPANITYNIVSLYDGDVDTLIVEGQYKWDAGDGGYWRFALVHYDDPNDEPPIPGNKPSVGFTLTWNGLQVTCNNTTTGADTYLWDFGDGTTETSQNPVHTYIAEGIYTITLTATNANGSNTSSAVAFVTATFISDALLQAGPWKVRVDDLAVFVGSGLGKNDWWHVSKSMLDGSTTGTDDWSAMTNDEFIFSAGGVYEYKTNGDARNDGWWAEYSNGTITDAQIASSANNGPAFGSGIHSYVLTPPSGGNRGIIELTNGATGAAFLGFVKGFYGGENTNSSNLPNGGNASNKYEVMGYANTGSKEYLFVSVDISGDHGGGAAWSVILER